MRQLLDSTVTTVTPEELADLEALLGIIEPFGEDRADMRAANIAQIAAVAGHVTIDGRKPTPDDFLVCRPAVEPKKAGQSFEDMRRVIRNMGGRKR